LNSGETMGIAEKKDIENIKENWQAVFKDSREFIDLFFNTFKNKGIIVKHSEEERILSSAALIDMKYRLKNGVLNAYYIYAAMTLPEHRGKGIMSRLITEGLKICSKKNPLCLVFPAKPSLVSYYSRFGFARSFKLYESIISRDDLKNHIGKEDGLNEVNIALKEHLNIINKEFSVNRDLETYEFTIKENSNANGSLFIGENGYMFVREYDDYVLIKDYSLSMKEFPQAAALLYNRFERNKFVFHSRKNVIPFKMHSINAPMARITNVKSALDIFAAENKDIEITIRVNDPLISQNSGVYRIADGVANLTYSLYNIDLDYNITELTDYILSSGRQYEPYGNMMFD